MKTVLFVIPNLGHGGAEKVLVNLVNHMDKKKFNITVMALYDEGVNKEALSSDVEYRFWKRKSFPGIAHLLKICSPEVLYNIIVKKHYDIVVSYLEGQTARIVSGCVNKNCRKVCWIHRTMTTKRDAARLFRSEKEALLCYGSYDKIISVSKDVEKAFMDIFPFRDKGKILYNTNETDQIIKKSKDSIPNGIFDEKSIKLCAMGTLTPVKGFERLISIHKKLLESYPVHTYILGEGPELKRLQELTKKIDVEESVTFLGYQKNPYKYMKQCDIFVCSSYSEGFSTAVTESLILGLPVVTTNVSGMDELLGNNEYGIIANNDEVSLYEAIELLLSDSERYNHYRKMASMRGERFSTANTIKAVENFLDKLTEG